MSKSLESIGLRHSTLSDRILLARFGKDPETALETRDAMNEFWQTLTSYAFDGEMPDVGQSVEVKFGGGNEQFRLTLTRLEASEPEQ